MADKRISQLIERTDIANNDVLPIVASGATTTNKVTISTIQTWMQDNLDVGVTSVGLSMPSAFVVSNSPVTASGNITVTGAGTVAQYIRGDGSLADFPQSAGGGGASVSYYLNGSVSQGTIGGIAYLEMNKTPILGAGTDFTIAADGYIASFITDAGDPGLLEIPAGNWNFETYLSATSGGGSPTFYIELYKVNSGGTATLIASNSATPESISLGTNINPYFSALAVPTTTLALTDRLALRYYVTHAGRTITLHTENSHLCQIITTFTTGLTALNGLTAQVQNFATGTSGTDFNISSAGSTHTFNIPSASATARGLVTTGSQTIAGAKTFLNDAVFNDVNIGRGAGNFTSNTRVGLTALQFNTTGQQNTAVGTQVLLLNTEGGFNTGLGYNALLRNTTGGSNTAVGAQTLKENTIGTHNTAVGVFALIGNTTGSANSSFGTFALENNTTGGSNTAVGYEALKTNTTGGNNTAVGFQALRSNTGNGANTAVGNLSLWNNTAGLNTALGNISLYSNTTGEYNVGLGIASLYNNTTGSYNIAIGDQSGQFISGGGNNIISNNSLFIGTQTRALGNNQTNQIVIGHNAVGNGSNTVTIGNSSITDTYLRGAVRLSDTGTNSSIIITSDSTGSGAIHLTKNTNGTGIRITNNGVGEGILALNNSTGSAITIGNISTGKGLIIDNAAAATGDPFVYTLGGAAFVKAKIDYLGNLTANQATLTGALTGTSATFAGRARFQGTGYDTLGSAEIMLTNTTASTGRSFIVNSSNAGEFLISDVSAGQTRLSINSSGAVTLTGALSGTSASFSGAITSTVGNNSTLLNSASATNGWVQIAMNNTTGSTLLGIEGATAGTLATGTNAYASVLRNYTATDFQIATNNIVRATISSTGAATFSSSVTARNGTSGVAFQTTNAVNADFTIETTSGGLTKIGTSGNALGINVGGGNVGIGTTPSSWGTVFTKSAIQFGGSVGVGALWTNSFNNGVFLGNNIYDDGAGNARYIINGTSTQYVQAGGEHFWSNAPSGTAGNVATFTERMRITSGGQVQITQSANTHAAGGLTLINNAGNPWNFVNGGDNNLYLGYAGTSRGVFATNGVYTPISDINKKKDLEESQIGLNEVMALKPTLYRMSDDDSEGQKELGFIAQEVKEVIPNAYVESGEDEEKFIGLNYNPIVAALVKAMQEQQEQIKSLNEQVEALKSQING